MNILYDNTIFITQNYGGVPRYFYELMNYYAENKLLKFNFPVVYSENEYIKDSYLAPWVRFFRHSGLLKIGEIRKNLRRLNKFMVKNAIKSGKYDVFHPTFYEDHYLDWIGNKKFVITIHDMIQEIYAEDFKNDVNQAAKYKKMCAHRADKIIAVSENTKKDILRFYPDISPDKIAVIHHGNPFDRFKTYKKPNINMPEKYILFVGNRNLYKNFNFFAESIAPLLAENTSLKLLITGSAALNQQEIQLFEDLGVSNSIIYHKSTDSELLYMYKNALCFVFPSLYEGFGFQLLESFGAGCPVACSNSSSLPEVGQNACLYFDPSDKNAILESVSKLVYDKELRHELIERGYARAKDFSWEQTALKTLKVYEGLL